MFGKRKKLEQQVEYFHVSFQGKIDAMEKMVLNAMRSDTILKTDAAYSLEALRGAEEALKRKRYNDALSFYEVAVRYAWKDVKP